MNIPEDLKYTREHEWVLIEEGAGTVGITDYAQSELGDIVFVELPQVGTRIEKDGPAGTIEAVKTVADLYAPVTGEVIEVNQRLEETPEKVNAEPYGEGWIFKVAVEDAEELDSLLDAAEYAKLIDDQS